MPVQCRMPLVLNPSILLSVCGNTYKSQLSAMSAASFSVLGLSAVRLRSMRKIQHTRARTHTHTHTHAHNHTHMNDEVGVKVYIGCGKWRGSTATATTLL